MAEGQQHRARPLRARRHAFFGLRATRRLALVAGLALPLFSTLAPAQSRQVLVYLGNEVSPSRREARNINEIASWLQASPFANDQILAEGILEDLRSFPATVDASLDAIKRHSSAAPLALVATNRLLQSGAVLVRNGVEFERVAIGVVAPQDGREESSPLSNALNVRSVLALAASVFPPDQHEFVLAVHSHGDEQFAITPRLGLPTEGLTRETLLARVHGSENAFVDRYGITTAALMRLLAEERRARGFRTALLILASCESTIEELPVEVPLALVAANGQPLPFGVIDYDKVLDSSEPTLGQAFIATLTPTPFEVADPSAVVRRRWRRRAEQVFAALPYFGPLAVWVCVFSWLRFSRARPKRERPCTQQH